jgi:biotin synthase
LTQTIDQLAAGCTERGTLRAALLATGTEQEQLFALARSRRDAAFPDGRVEVRSVIEISNICGQRCRYCRIGAGEITFQYTLGHDAVLEIVDALYARGRRNLLIQSGENPSQGFVDHVSRCIFDLKQRYADLELILNLGTLSRRQYQQLRDSGAGRCILKFETSNPTLFRHLKPRACLEDRLDRIRDLAELGFGVGSGNIVGLPGQTVDDLVEDLVLLEELTLTMASASVFIPGKGTEFEGHAPGDLDQALNMMALIRVMNPQRRIPSTSSLERVGAGGQLRGLLAGANTVTIHDGTPASVVSQYPIYSADRFTPDASFIRQIVAAASLGMG